MLKLNFVTLVMRSKIMRGLAKVNFVFFLFLIVCIAHAKDTYVDNDNTEGLKAIQMETRSYRQGMITMSDGRIIKGKNLIMNLDSVSIDTDGSRVTYELSEVQQIMVKGGLARKWGVGCLGLSFVVDIYQIAIYGFYPEEDVPLILLRGVFSGLIGRIIGHLLDNWKPIYLSPQRTKR